MNWANVSKPVRTGKDTHTQKKGHRGLSFLIFVSQISQKQTQIFDLSHEHN